jgi:hypothetical protein
MSRGDLSAMYSYASDELDPMMKRLLQQLVIHRPRYGQNGPIDPIF